MRKSHKIEGILHDVEVRLVTQRYLNRLVANRGESVEGAYVADEDVIYIARELSEQNKIHTLLHELFHVFEHHSERMDSEARADSFAALLIRIFQPKLEDLLK